MQQEYQQKALKSDIKKLNNLTKSYISLQNIESTLKDEFETNQRKDSTSVHNTRTSSSSNNNSSNEKLTANRESSSPYKPILKKSPNNELLIDSDNTSSSNLEAKQTLREKLNSEFHQVRQRRNYFNSVNYNSYHNTDVIYNKKDMVSAGSSLNVVR